MDRTAVQISKDAQPLCRTVASSAPAEVQNCQTRFHGEFPALADMTRCLALLGLASPLVKGRYHDSHLRGLQGFFSGHRTHSSMAESGYLPTTMGAVGPGSFLPHCSSAWGQVHLSCEETPNDSHPTAMPRHPQELIAQVVSWLPSGSRAFGQRTGLGARMSVCVAI